MISKTKQNILRYIDSRNCYGYQISIELGIPISTVYSHLFSLEKQGFIQRKKENSHRQIYYEITQRGKHLILAIE